MRFTPQLLPSRSGNLGILSLNNPKALNALTLDMIYCFQDVLQEWNKPESNIKAILLKSNHNSSTYGNDDDAKKKKKKTPAFCAGGDVKTLYQSWAEDGDNKQKHGYGHSDLPTSEFFKQEYRMNYLLATSQIPQISIWDGIVMGGGMGISYASTYRIATENTIFAMPETAIGLFPDVGSTYYMNSILKKSPGHAVYLGLTGQRLKDPNDLLYTGLATHYIPSSKLEDFERDLIDACSSKMGDGDEDEPLSSSIAPLLMSYHETPPTLTDDSAVMSKHFNTIHHVFGNALDPPDDPDYQKSEGVEGMIRALQELVASDNTNVNDDTKAFAQRTIDTLNRMSPTSLKLTLEGLRRGSWDPDIEDTFVMEYRMSQRCMLDGSDFYEGIRAALIDKDNQPKWDPSRLEDVTDDMIQSYFEPLEQEYEWKPPSTSSTDTA